MNLYLLQIADGLSMVNWLLVIMFSPLKVNPSRFLQQVRDIFKPCLKFTFLDGAEIVSGKTHLWRRVNHKRSRPYLGKREGKYKYKVGSISYREGEIVEAQNLKLKDDVGILEQPLYYTEKISPYPSLYSRSLAW